MVTSDATEQAVPAPETSCGYDVSDLEKIFASPCVQRLAPTARQLLVLRTIYESVRVRGYAPSLREIGAAMGITSTNGISDHLRALARWGWVARTRSRARALSLTDEGLSVLGEVALPSPQRAPTPADPVQREGPGWVLGSVYFLEAEGAGRIKIGFTAGPLDERRRQIQVGSPFVLVVRASFTGSMNDESRLHGRFFASRCASGNEWFHAVPSLRSLIDTVAASSPGRARRAAMRTP